MSKLLQAVPREFHGVARHYIRQWSTLGWSQDQIAHGLQFGLSYTGPPEELAGAFQTFASHRLGLAPEVAALATNAAEELHTHINTKGFEGLPALPVDETQAILDDIRAYRRQWPADYEQDAAMKEAELKLLTAQQGGEALTTVPAQARNPASDAVARLAEIRQMRRDDPHSYDGNRALQQEELGLIEQSLPKSAAVSSGTDSAPVAQPASEGTSSGE